MAATISLDSFSAISLGIPAGPITAAQATTENFGNRSVRLGIDGASGDRCGKVVANAFNLPSFTKASAEPGVASINCTRLVTRSAIPAGSPR